VAQHNAYGDKIYFWVDTDGVRCSPRHRTLKAALSYIKDTEHYWASDENGRARQFERDRATLPSQGRPVNLRTGEYIERDLSAEEQTKLDQVRQLMAEGFV
jgi:hypothetical protein